MAENYRGRCPMCGEWGTSEHGPQSAILAHVGSVHMTPDVAGYLHEAYKVMGAQWFLVGLADAAKRQRKRVKPVPAVATQRQIIDTMVYGLERGVTPYEKRQIDDYEAAIVAREREWYEDRIHYLDAEVKECEARIEALEAQLDTMGNDNLWLSMEREALTFKKEEQAARIEALGAVVKAVHAQHDRDHWADNNNGGLTLWPWDTCTDAVCTAARLAALDQEVQP